MFRNSLTFKVQLSSTSMDKDVIKLVNFLNVNLERLFGVKKERDMFSFPLNDTMSRLRDLEGEPFATSVMRSQCLKR